MENVVFTDVLDVSLGLPQCTVSRSLMITFFINEIVKNLKYIKGVKKHYHCNTDVLTVKFLSCGQKGLHVNFYTYNIDLRITSILNV